MLYVKTLVPERCLCSDVSLPLSFHHHILHIYHATSTSNNGNIHSIYLGHLRLCLPGEEAEIVDLILNHKVLLLTLKIL